MLFNILDWLFQRLSLMRATDVDFSRVMAVPGISPNSSDLNPMPSVAGWVLQYWMPTLSPFVPYIQLIKITE
jgi:hypothetical protein